MSLSLNNLCIGNVLIEINHCESTNLVAKNLLSKSKPIEGTVILTDYQTKGKGQIGNVWQSKPNKNLLFSIILKPNFLKPEQQFLLSKVVSIACAETLSFFAKKEFKIKWPNDIYTEDKKITGILIENIISGNNLSNSIVGVGMNINQEHFDGLPRVTSLKNILYKEVNRIKVLKHFLKLMDQLYHQLRKGNVEVIHTLYKEKMLGLNEERVFIKEGILFKAKVKGVNEIGQLILEKENKQVSVYHQKEVVWKF